LKSTSSDKINKATEDAIRLRERHHANGNRFGMMSRYHQGEAALMLGPKAARHLALADKWALGQHLEYVAASAISNALGIPEYGRAWNERLTPIDLEKENANA
jgi:hypothetical protein